MTVREDMPIIVNDEAAPDVFCWIDLEEPVAPENGARDVDGRKAASLVYVDVVELVRVEARGTRCFSRGEKLESLPKPGKRCRKRPPLDVASTKPPTSTAANSTARNFISECSEVIRTLCESVRLFVLSVPMCLSRSQRISFFLRAASDG